MSQTVPSPASDTIASDTDGSPVPPRSTEALRGRTVMLLLLTLIYSLNHLDRQILLILQEPIKADFQLADWQLGLLTGGAFGIFYTAMGIPIAHIIDRGVNRVRLIAGMTIAWSIMTALCGLARGFGQLFGARLGVGLAEAGFAPAAHSLISDRYAPRERSAAAGLFAVGVPIGMMAGLSIGGSVAYFSDWRTALLLAAVPGILVAILFLFVVREPVRGESDVAGVAVPSGETQAAIGFLEGLKVLARRPAFVHVVIGSAFCAFATAGIGAWMPSFLIRTYDMNLAEVGIGLGLIAGIGGGIGTWLGGWQGTRLGRSGLHAIVWIPIAGLLLSVPFYLAALNMHAGATALLWLIPPSILSVLWSAPSIALTQNLAPVAMRARASAVYIVAANLIGVSMGPMAIGFMSEFFAGFHNGDSALGLRDAQMVLTLFLLVGAAQWIYVSRLLRRETDGHPALN